MYNTCQHTCYTVEGVRRAQRVRYSTAQRENAKTASFQGLLQRGINEKSVCMRGRSAKRHGHDGHNVMSSRGHSRIVIIEMFIHNEYYT
jgi:hypothetical protein